MILHAYILFNTQKDKSIFLIQFIHTESIEIFWLSELVCGQFFKVNDWLHILAT